MADSVHDIAVEFVGLDEGDRWTLLKHIKAQLEKKTSLKKVFMDDYYVADNSDLSAPSVPKGPKSCCRWSVSAWARGNTRSIWPACVKFCALSPSPAFHRCRILS